MGNKVMLMSINSELDHMTASVHMTTCVIFFKSNVYDYNFMYNCLLFECIPVLIFMLCKACIYFTLYYPCYLLIVY